MSYDCKVYRLGDQKFFYETKNVSIILKWKKEEKKRLKFLSENSENSFDVATIKRLVYKESLISVISFSGAIKITLEKLTSSNLWKTMDA